MLLLLLLLLPNSSTGVALDGDPSRGPDAAWDHEEVTGSQAWGRAKERGLAWDEGADGPLLPSDPPALMVETALGVFDTRGMAYPEMAKDFARQTGRSLPPAIGARIVLLTKWRPAAAMNRRLMIPLERP